MSQARAPFLELARFQGLGFRLFGLRVTHGALIQREDKESLAPSAIVFRLKRLRVEGLGFRVQGLGVFGMTPCRAETLTQPGASLGDVGFTVPLNPKP